MKLIIASIILGGSIIFATFLYTNNHKSEVIEKDYLFNIEPIEKDNPFNITKLGCTTEDRSMTDGYLFLRIDDARKKLRINMGNERDFTRDSEGEIYTYRNERYDLTFKIDNGDLITTRYGNSIKWSCELID